MIVRTSARASDDLANIYAYILVRQGVKSAEQWTSRHKDLRFWVISRTNYIIYYFAEPDHVSIERVLDGRRDVKRIFDMRKENLGD